MVHHRVLALAALLVVAGSVAPADTLRLQRGVNAEQWTNWGTIAELMADPEALAVFPDWLRHVTPAMFEALSDEGFDFIRLPLDPGPALVYGPGPDQDRMIDGMRAATNLALDAGLKVIVDLHPIPRGDEIGGAESIVGDQFPDYVALVGHIASRLSDLPADRVALELLNEPVFDCDGVYAGAPPKWPDMQARLHAAARRGAPDLTLILTGACWGQAASLASLDPSLIQDDNVLWTFHSYAPFTFTHQGAVWIDPPLKYITRVPFPPSLMTPEIVAEVTKSAVARMEAAEGTADAEVIARIVQEYADTPESAVNEEITRAAAWADAHGIPRDRVLLGEFGALHTPDEVPQPMEWYHAFISAKRKAAEDAGFGWAILSWNGGMGVAMPDDPDRRLSPDTCRALGLPCGN